MMDFSQDELLEVVERLAAGMLERAGMIAPPVNALSIAETQLGIPIEWVEPVEEDESGRRRPKFHRSSTLVVSLTHDMSDEQQQRTAADTIARSLLPAIYKKLNIDPENVNKQFAAHIRALTAARILIPTRLLKSALREYKYDVPALQSHFRNVSMEAIALRLLDLEEPAVLAIVDDGIVSTRKSNRFQASKKLVEAEQECVDRIMELDLPHRARIGGWTTCGWPVPNRPFRRILLRSVPDDV